MEHKSRVIPEDGKLLFAEIDVKGNETDADRM